MKSAILKILAALALLVAVSAPLAAGPKTCPTGQACGCPNGDC